MFACGLERSLSVGQLIKDGVVRLVAATFGVYLLLYLTPVLGADSRVSFSELYSEPPLLLMAIAGLLIGIRRMRHPEERRFWALWTMGFGCWLFGSLLTIVSARAGLAWLEVPSDSLFLLSFLACILTADQRPHLPAGWSAGDPSYRFSMAGTLLSLLALIIYFFSIPAVVSGVGDSFWYPTSFLFLALDVLLCVRFLHLWGISRDRNWRAVYGIIAALAGLWLCTDALEYLVSNGQLDLAYGTLWDFLWYLPFCAIVLVRRGRLQTVESQRLAATLERGEHPEVATPDLLLLYAFLLPLFHIGLSALGMFDVTGGTARELLVLASLIAFISLAVAQHHLLARNNRELQMAVAARTMGEQMQQARKLEAIGRLAGGVAHDFNNLLMVMQARASLMRDRLPVKPPTHDELQEIVSAADRGATLTRQLLAFSRKQVLQATPMELNRAIEDTVGMLRRLVGETIALETDLDRQLGWIKADPGQVLQVLLNLAANARDAMPNGGRLLIGTGNVRLEEEDALRIPSATAGDYVALTVRDTGHGMDDDTRSRVFEPFYSTKDLGTGLGLATVYGIVNQSGGFVRLSSRRGEGTTFQVCFPRVAAGDSSTVPDTPVDMLFDRRGTVLLAEDEASVRAVVRDLLEVAGVRVLEAGDGEEAARLAREHDGPIDLLLTDVVMPGMNGWRLAETVRANRPDARVLFMSGYPEPLDETHSISSRDGFIQKPFSPDDLMRKLGSFLGTGITRQAV